MLPIGDDKVSLKAFAGFTATVFSLYVKMKGAPASAVVVEKDPSEMPGHVSWHYVNTEMKDGKPVITVWINKMQQKREDGVAAMQAAGALGVMDAGLGGDEFQVLYAKAKAADIAAGGDSWSHRRDLAATIAATIMVILSK
ncbi:MAG: hypothetical protein NVSMB31_04120 [Vulcanimicrobiaceae bacterium]